MNVRLKQCICYLIGMAFFLSFHATFAEYYIACETGRPAKRIIPFHHHVIHKKVKSHKIYRTAYHKRAIIKKPHYYPTYQFRHIKTCCLCQEVWFHGHWACYGGCQSSHAFHPKKGMIYNPDLTTGDDDTWRNPNLQIND